MQEFCDLRSALEILLREERGGSKARSKASFPLSRWRNPNYPSWKETQQGKYQRWGNTLTLFSYYWVLPFPMWYTYMLFLSTVWPFTTSFSWIVTNIFDREIIKSSAIQRTSIIRIMVQCIISHSVGLLRIIWQFWDWPTNMGSYFFQCLPIVSDESSSSSLNETFYNEGSGMAAWVKKYHF